MGDRAGIAYTLVAILLLMVIANVFFSQSRTTSHESFSAVEERVRSMNNFLHDFDRDSERAAYISGFRSFIAMEQMIANSGDYTKDPDAVFKEFFVNGSYNGTNTTDIMQNATFNYYLYRAQQEAAKQGLLFNVTVERLALWQADPWSLKVNYTLRYTVRDRSGTANWSMVKTLIGTVPFTGVRDPLFLVNTSGRYTRTFIRSNTTLFVNGSSLNNSDPSMLVAHYDSGQYIAAGRGPSILMRFAGKYNESSIYGIESLVNISAIKLQDNKIGVDPDAAVVDFMYFNHTVAAYCDFKNNDRSMSPEFKLDPNSLALYNITASKLNYTVCS
jgi:hypothetical protein